MIHVRSFFFNPVRVVTHTGKLLTRTENLPQII
jgi:hypothetical protein